MIFNSLLLTLTLVYLVNSNESPDEYTLASGYFEPACYCNFTIPGVNTDPNRARILNGHNATEFLKTVGPLYDCFYHKKLQKGKLRLKIFKN